MHEIGIVQNTLDLALSTAGASGASRILSIRMRVGALTGVVPEALEFAFEALRQGTIAEQARLEIEAVPVRAWCPQCRAEFDCEDWIQECPKCHRLSTDLRSGLELELVSVELG